MTGNIPRWLTAIGLLGLLVGFLLASSSYLRSFRIEYLGSGGVILQPTPVTCGPAALAQVMRSYGVDVPVTELAQVAATGENGTNMLALTRAAEVYGFSATGYQVDLAYLRKVPTPLIAVFPHHFVTISAVTPNYIEVLDPLRGRLRYGKRAFEQAWQRKILVMEKR